MLLGQPEAIPGAQGGAEAVPVLFAAWVGATAVWAVLLLAWAYYRQRSKRP